ncbi:MULTISPECIES: HesB/IscA family protein [Piscirickettsiaceae]|jgi:iron-sulfur cluster assembly protein|uniref:Iron-sulfur cluster assembly accessory protein n=1 Tax=Hydrogenovibrio thermophilus TaxID=265883 RepID=A0A410H1Q5_9GAMM|nr:MULTISPECIES: iron-sulfur cluster assembly accessory protein [Piscirickettsiaceae]AZR82589.1 iron-sulfur cluster assembly protein IscA [Thiomicrospira sp. S5]QAB14848.1 iron-sulfur cluster assembly accessory protein [Hydrogenovibrio thermophilus]
MAVTLTEAAAQRVKTMLDKRGHGIGLKVSTKVSGCTGFAYVVDYADEITEGDNVYESFGVQVVVPKKSLEQIDGMELDYVKESLLNEGFEFNNPNVKDSCGCGESFSV